MHEYYGIPSQSDFFMHYGVKGMKWGIRKAVERTGYRQRSPGYSRIRQKLEDLQQKKIQKQINKVQKARAFGKIRKVRRMYDKASEHLNELDKNANRTYNRAQVDQNKDMAHDLFWWGEGMTKNKYVRYANWKDRRFNKKLTTNKGHAKAVRTRNAYADQMARMFKNTAYESQTKRAAKKKVHYQF